MLGVDEEEEDEEEEEVEGQGEEGLEVVEQEKENENQGQPKRKKRKLVVKKRRNDKRGFQQSWKKAHDWLEYSESQGMWCAICYPFRQHPGVIGQEPKRNALALPTKKILVSHRFKACKHKLPPECTGAKQSAPGSHVKATNSFAWRKGRPSQGTFSHCPIHGTQRHCTLPNACIDGLAERKRCEV